MKNTKGITLISLVITIIVLLILTRSYNWSTYTEIIGIINQAAKAKKASEKQDEKELIQTSYIACSLHHGKDNKEMFENVKEHIGWKKAQFNINNECMQITTENNNKYTLLEDGTLLDGLYAYLNIEDGSIDIYSNGYKQGETLLR